MVAILAGCATPSRPAAPAPRSSCAIVASETSPAESIAVATPLPIAAGTTTPSNAAERFIDAQAYETLVGVDCEGQAYPGLAQSWIRDETKTRVTLTLRAGAHFWNGDPLSARDVVAAWRASEVARRIADATTVVDDRTLTVSLPDTAWLVLATPALAISRPRAGARWPEGSGPYRLTEPAMDAAPGRLTLIPSDNRSAPRIVIRPGQGADARDAIDAGVDVLVGADAAAVRYAGTRPELASIPLPWLRTYALAVPSRAPRTVADVLSSSGDSAGSFRASLARDAVRAEARPAAGGGWWSDVEGCESSRPNQPVPNGASQRQARIAYRADDQVARELADRLVALGRHAVATPLSPSEFARSLRNGGELAYIVAIPRVSLAPCHDVAGLLSIAPWLSDAGARVASDAITPLVDTRERAIVNRARVSATIDWDGALRLGRTPARP